MIEATFTFVALLFLFFCVYTSFLMAIDKIRALDTVYHLARARQVGKSAWPLIICPGFKSRGAHFQNKAFRISI